MKLAFISVIILVILYTLYMGLQDGANAIATPIASGSMSRFETILIATFFNIISPIIIFSLGNKSVASTISGSIINNNNIIHLAETKPYYGAIFVVAGILSATLWLIITSILHIPSSSSHSMLGGIIGAAIPIYGFSSLNGLNIFLKVILVALLTPAVAMIISYIIMQAMKLIGKYLRSRFMYIIMILQRINVMILSASIAINDVMKSMGIFMLLIIATGKEINKMNFLLQLDGILMISILSVVFALGLLFGGKKMAHTIGNNIYQVSRFDAFVVQFASESITFTSSLIGLPVSTGQIISSSIMGIGAASNMNLVKWGVSKKIFMNWVLTLPATIIFGAFVVTFLKGVIN